MTRDELVDGFMKLGCRATTSRDRRRGYSSELVRCGCGRHALAGTVVGKKPADAVKRLGAAISWHLNEGKSGPLTYVLGRDKKGGWVHAIDALQRLSTKGVSVELQVDFAAPPPVSARDLSHESWPEDLRRLMQRRLPQSAKALEGLVSGIGFRWHRSVTGDYWSGRLDGLEVCAFSALGELTFGVGSPQSDSDDDAASPPRISNVVALSRKIIGNRTRFGTAPSATASFELTRDDLLAAAAILKELHEADVAALGSPEHRLEARVLRGQVTIPTRRGVLELVEPTRPFQFPARFWTGGNARYIDVLAREGKSPVVVELKVEQGQGTYYRDGIVQAALYRNFVRDADRLEPWFNERALDRRSCRAVLVIPPLRGPRAAELQADHHRVADEFDVELVVLPEAGL